MEAGVFTTGGRTEACGHLNFRDQLLDLSDFLRGRPHPLGLFAVDVDHAWRAMLAARRAGLRVPEDVALICGGEDEVLFDSVRPGITGILYDNERVGYEAAAALDALMRWRAWPLCACRLRSCPTCAFQRSWCGRIIQTFRRGASSGP